MANAVIELKFVTVEDGPVCYPSCHAPLPLSGAVCSLAWSMSGSKFAVASTSGCVQLYSGSGREYTPSTEIKEVQV